MSAVPGARSLWRLRRVSRSRSTGPTASRTCCWSPPAWSCSPLLPAGATGDDPRRRRAGQGGRLRRARATSPTTSHARARGSRSGTRFWVSTLVTAITIPLRSPSPTRSRAAACASRRCCATIALVPILAPSLLAAISFIFWFGNQGLLKRCSCGAQIYGAPGIVMSRGVHDLSACAHDPASPRSRSPTRASTKLRTRSARAAAQVLDHHACRAPSTGSSARRWWCSPTRQRLRHPQGDRRQLQHARHRHLQAGDRPAGLRQGRGGRRSSCWCRWP